MQIEYKKNIIIIEGGDNDVYDDIYEFITGNQPPTWDASKQGVYTYNDFVAKTGYNEIIKSTVRKYEDIKWCTTNIEISEETILLNSYKLNCAPENIRSEAERYVKQFIDQYGYNTATSKTGSNLVYSWKLNENGNEIVYEFEGQISTNPNTRQSSVSGKLIKTTISEGSLETGETKLSTSYELKDTIGKWYLTLRTIALVGLLSVLVYVGIRIIISSTGQEKAKYKKMIGDWLAAICILFVLHYIMAFTMAMVESVLDIFKIDGIVNANGEDVLMTRIRNSVNTNGMLSTSFAELLIYLALVVFTAVFTFHYLKRLVYLAFFTMIAPLIALTYPLDKIKDGQAQAFGIWIKEYIFNALMPVMHLLLYYIFVGSAMDLATSNPIYALVCIGFLIPAEKFFRKMFGFDKATSSSQFGAAAGGAMVMNAINKISHAGGSGGSGGKSGKSGSGASGGSDSSPARISNRPDGGTPSTDPADNNPKNPIFGGGNDPLNQRPGAPGITGATKQRRFMSGLRTDPKRTIKRSCNRCLERLRKCKKTIFEFGESS